MSGTTCVVVNPAAGRGRIRHAAPQIRSVFAARGITDVVETAAPGEEEVLAQQLVNGGATTIIAVGGDGTCSGVANGILRSGIKCRLAVLPCGTGNDFAKTLGVARHTPEMIADLALRGEETRIDVGLADGRYFLNSCGFGFDAAVLEASNRVRFLAGNAVYIYSALTKLLTYRGVHTSVRGAPGVEGGKMLMVIVSNGRWLGGAFKIAPTASVLDGRLDACFFLDANVFRRVRLFAGAMRGTHLNMQSVRSTDFARLALTFPANANIEMDGELRIATSTTVEISCVPSVLSVLAAPGALA
ncbi:MAG: diacylglycerol/lipid kinase family protein [Gemmatimonadaceae bacterium]